MNNIKKEENNRDNKILDLNNIKNKNNNNENNDIININKEIKEPISENKEEEKDELNNNINQNLNRITEGVNIFYNYINIQYKIKFIRLLKQRNSFLLKINNALITLENIIFQIKLFHKKKFFVNVLSKQTLGVHENKRLSTKPKNIIFNENLNSPKLSRTNSNIKNKIKKLEFIKQRETEYINMIEKQKQKKQEPTENINMKIKKSQKLEETPNKKDDKSIISDRSSSELSDYYEPRNNFKNCFEILIFLFKKNIQKNEIIFLENLNEKISTKKTNNKKALLKKYFLLKKFLQKIMMK